MRTGSSARSRTHAASRPRSDASTSCVRSSSWRGPALAEFAFDDFAQPEIRRLDELRLAALEERIDADLELGRHGDVIGELEALVAEHPLRESFVRQLMLALYRAGRQAEALDAYQDARARFVDELGIEPGPSCASFRRRSSATRPGSRATPAAAATRRGRRDRRRARSPGASCRCSGSTARAISPTQLAERVRRARRPAHRPRPRLPVRRDDERLRPALRRAAQRASRPRSSPARCTASSPGSRRSCASAARRTSSSSPRTTTSRSSAPSRRRARSSTSSPTLPPGRSAAGSGTARPTSRRGRSTSRTRMRPSSRSSAGRSS